MLQRRLLLVLTTLFFLVAARQRAVRHPALPEHPIPPVDVFTYSRPAEVRVDHVELDLTVDFERRVLRGTATLRLDNRTGADTLVLDTHQLTISSVLLDGTVENPWVFEETGEYGTPLVIGIGPSTRTVTIGYETSPGAPGLYWNAAAQSSGRQQPFVYSLNEPIGARSWIPIQDTPSSRMTYSARLHVPPGMLALMSAGNNPREINELGVYEFAISQPVPAYLIALAVGRIEYRGFDERTGVYAEPELLDDAAWELQYLPEMLDVAEDILGPLPFPRHDLLLMPPTFEVGGMEHPNLNFIHPLSVVTGNRPAAQEPATLIAHELAHAWSGDLATLATWNDVWLNEGITSYLAARIIEELEGAERAELAWFLDRRSYASFAENAEPGTTRLHREVPHPWAGFDSTAYVKGALFIRTLEDSMGREALDSFLREYFRRFSWRWVDHAGFLELLRGRLATRPGLEESLRLDEWVYSPGLPLNTTAPTSSATYDRAVSRMVAFRNGTPIAQLAPQTWERHEIELFLQLVPVASLGPRMAEVDAAFGLSFQQSPPFVWIIRSAMTGYRPADAAVERALARGGSNNMIAQIYSVLATTDRPRALALFARYRDRYHDAIEQQIAEMLGPVANAA